jgi:hypothetical protein
MVRGHDLNTGISPVLPHMRANQRTRGLEHPVLNLQLFTGVRITVKLGICWRTELERSIDLEMASNADCPCRRFVDSEAAAMPSNRLVPGQGISLLALAFAQTPKVTQFDQLNCLAPNQVDKYF